MCCTYLTDDIQYNSVNVSNVGIFTCPISVLVRLDPSEKATFSLLNTDPVKEGDDVTMKCETDGNPQPEFDFSKDVRVHFMYIYVCLRETERANVCCFSAFAKSIPTFSKNVIMFVSLSLSLYPRLSLPMPVLSPSGKNYHWPEWSPGAEICKSHRWWCV